MVRRQIVWLGSATKSDLKGAYFPVVSFFSIMMSMTDLVALEWVVG